MHNPQLWSKFSKRAGSENDFVLENYLDYMKFKKENVSILDAGCGDGNYTINLFPKIPKRCKELVGIDVSEEMVKFASKSCNRPEIKFVQLDIATKKIPLEFYQRFDHAFTFFAFHWIPNKRAAYKNMYDMLGPEGDLLGVYMLKGPKFDAFVKLSKCSRWKPFFPKDFIRCLENIENEERKTEIILKEVGFTNCFCKAEKRTPVWRNAEEYREFLAATDPIYYKLNNHEKIEYLDDLLEELEKTHKGITFFPSETEGGPVHVEDVVLIVYASKTQNS